MENVLAWVVPSVVGGTAVVGIVGQWFTKKAKNDQHAEGIKEALELVDKAQKRADDAHTATGALELRIEREFVRKNDLAEVESRIGKRLDGVTHDLKGAITQIIPALAVLKGRPNARGAE